MSADCAQISRAAIVAPGYRRAVWIALGLNVAMFIAEVIAGLEAGSTALLADALDFFSDSAAYIITLAALGWTLRSRANAALFKAGIMVAMGIAVAWTGIAHAMSGTVPQAGIVGALSLAALAANVASAAVLLPDRGGDANQRSLWLCSRNDAIANIAVLVSAGIVAVTGTLWADLAVAIGIAAIEMRSAGSIIAQALGERPEAEGHGHA
ncbi:MAG: cation transporter [Alphaproteobacteria bacterium]|nr:cation transporter [Alphaproteobacteria bacterium]